MTVSDYIFGYLADQGVTHCFYLPGGGSMHLVDALARQDRIVSIAMLHEQAAAIASVAHNIYTNSLSSVVLVTTGPGGTNAITGVVAAWIDSTPLLVISGQVPTNLMMGDDFDGRQKGPQEVNITGIVEGITKDEWPVDPEDIWKFRNIFPRFIQDTVSFPSGPVWLDIPLDVQGAEI